MTTAQTNLFCRSSDLTNEASVEMFFVSRLLDALGYLDHEIRPKQAIKELRIPIGSRTERYTPDYLIIAKRKPRWLIETKSINESIENYTYQGAGYALLINQKDVERPLRFYMLTNGLLTRVYIWDQDQAILSLRFGDFVGGHPKYEALKRLLAADAARGGWPLKSANLPFEKPIRQHALRRPTMDVVKRVFLQCHRIIWKSEKLSPQAAFVEFAKLLFVKLWEDRRLRTNPHLLEMIGTGDKLPASAVRFSLHWINQQEANTPNPVDTLLFRQLVEFLETEIEQRKRKRIFEAVERLRVSPGTAKRVVEKLEHYYLFGIDEDLNGRMFEAFLAATMRGQALGQYFTPRSVVKLVTRIARLRADRESVERVLDACCGTGGFLIEALTDMRRQVWDNLSLTEKERARLLDEVANQAIYGIDAGRDPMLARIARINMYLHGDGGSRVYVTDALRFLPAPSETDSVEVRQEVTELRSQLASGLLFDVVLTNPPFSMDYQVTVPEEREILQAYDIAVASGKKKKSLRSAVMFLERYWQLLKRGGRLITVIDDSVMGGKNYAYVRDFIRERFIIRAVISLHGDAFQRAGARVKTSVMYLTKRYDAREVQPSIFVYESRHIGLDDVVARTRPSVAAQARQDAVNEMEEIADAFEQYWNGGAGEWLIPPERLGDRLDAKSLRPWSVVELEPQWRGRGVDVEVLEDLVTPIDQCSTLEPDQTYWFLRITYEGHAERGEETLGSEVSYGRVGLTSAGDLVVSNISAVYRSICVIPDEMQGMLLSNEFTVMRLKPGVNADIHYIWSVLRSSAVIAEWLSRASGVGRTRVDWEILRSQKIPLLPVADQCHIGDLYRAAEEDKRHIQRKQRKAAAKLVELELEGEVARDRLVRAKPPR